METWVTKILATIAIGIEIGVGVIISLAVLETIARVTKVFLVRRRSSEKLKEEIRLNLGRWLALSLELAVAADILRSIIAPTWEEIGQLAAIIALRTLLNYFLAKEIEQAVREEDYTAD